MFVFRPTLGTSFWNCNARSNTSTLSVHKAARSPTINIVLGVFPQLEEYDSIFWCALSLSSDFRWNFAFQSLFIAFGIFNPRFFFFCIKYHRRAGRGTKDRELGLCSTYMFDQIMLIRFQGATLTDSQARAPCYECSKAPILLRFSCQRRIGVGG